MIINFVINFILKISVINFFSIKKSKRVCKVFLNLVLLLRLRRCISVTLTDTHRDFFIAMDRQNFLLWKKKKSSRNPTDGDYGKRPRETCSFDDSISKAANNGEFFEDKTLKLDDCVAILCNCMKNLANKINESI